MIPKETIDRIVELGTAAPQPIGDGEKFVVLPSTMKVENVTKYFPPAFIERRVCLIDGASFSDYVNLFKKEATLIFATVGDEGAVLTAFLDYHKPPDLAARCSHTAVFQTFPTTEWKTWMAANRKGMTQVEFATWLEDNGALFSEPNGAELMELVLSLEGKQDVHFTSAHRLDSGKNRFDYDEDVTLKGAPTSKTGSVDLPRELIAGIAPFHGAPKYAVRARLKYRIQSRALSLWFETIAPHLIIRESVLAVVKDVAEKTKIIPLLGNA